MTEKRKRIKLDGDIIELQSCKLRKKFKPDYYEAGDHDDDLITL